MAITKETIRLARRRTREVNEIIDQQIRDLVKAWVEAWSEIEPMLEGALMGLLADAGPDQTIPARHVAPAMAEVIEEIEATLDELAETTGNRLIQDLDALIIRSYRAEGEVLASQEPPDAQESARLREALMNPVDEQAISYMRDRTMDRVWSASQPLSKKAATQVKKQLRTGIETGENPRQVARNMIKKTKGEFNGGLNRAMVISRTEMMDAHRQAIAHRDVEAMAGSWRWLAALDRRTCPACLVMHGTIHGGAQAGPNGHPQCRCTRIGVMGEVQNNQFIPETPDDFPDAEEWFWSQDHDIQVEVMGKKRLELLQSGEVTWRDLVSYVDNEDWRGSWKMRSVRDLIDPPLDDPYLVFQGRSEASTQQDIMDHLVTDDMARDSRFVTVEVEPGDIENLIAGQDVRMDHQHIQRLMDDPDWAVVRGTDDPIIVRIGDSRFLVDGHHRAVAANWGNRSLRAFEIDLTDLVAMPSWTPNVAKVGARYAPGVIPDPSRPLRRLMARHKSPTWWQEMADPESRAMELWQSTFEGADSIRKIIRNSDAGAPIFRGVNLTKEGELYQTVAQALYKKHGAPFGSPYVYNTEDLKNDLLSAAKIVRDRVRTNTAKAPVLYRGMAIDNSSDFFRPGSIIDANFTSWSTNREMAEHFAGVPHLHLTNPDATVMIVKDMRALDLGLTKATSQRIEAMEEWLSDTKVRVIRRWREGPYHYIEVEPYG